MVCDLTTGCGVLVYERIQRADGDELGVKMSEPKWLEDDKRRTTICTKQAGYRPWQISVEGAEAALHRAHAHIEELREMVDSLARAECDGCGKGGACYDCDTGIQQNAGMCLLTVQRPPDCE